MSDFERQLGGLINDIQTLELLLRVFLHNNRPTGSLKTDFNLIENAAIGDQVSLDAFTNYDTLSELIDKVNQHPKATATKLLVDRSLVRLRDALAHGRKYARKPELPFKLIKFGKPANNQVQVEFVATVSTEWLVDQRMRLNCAIASLMVAIDAA